MKKRALVVIMKDSDSVLFAWRAVTLYATGTVVVAAFHLAQRWDLISRLTEGLYRFAISALLLTVIVVLSFRTTIARSLRWLILVASLAVLGDTLLGFTEDVRALDDVPVIGHDSRIRLITEPLLSGVWMVGGVCIICMSLVSMQRSQDELCLRIERHETAEQRLRLTLRELSETQHQLVHRERLSALGQMASAAAHDLNNALSPLASYIEILQGDKALSEQQQGLVDCMRRSTSDVASTVLRLQHFYGHDPGSEAEQVLDLAETVRETVACTKPKWKDEAELHGRNIELNVALAEGPLVSFVPSELRAVLTNLLFNAVDAMPNGGIISIESSVDDSHVALDISDTGVGMEREMASRCFEPFVTTKPTGSGLGLSACYGIIGRHRGTIAVTSEVGRGTTFRMRLPVTSRVFEAARESDSAVPTTLHVMIVDDNEKVRSSLEFMLASRGFQVTAAESGEQALELLAGSTNPDCVITDLGMPGMDGSQLVGLVRRTHPDLVIAVVSGWPVEQVSAMFADIEQPDFILGKPLLFNDLRPVFTAATARAAANCL